MILDSSAIIAVLLEEPGHERIVRALVEADEVGVGAPTMVETGIVLCARLGPVGKSLLARFVQEAGVTIVAFSADHWAIAVDAFLRYGKGRHPAALNFGDCLTYALGATSGRPLLCVGEDFSRTDLSLVG